MLARWLLFYALTFEQAFALRSGEQGPEMNVHKNIHKVSLISWISTRTQNYAGIAKCLLSSYLSVGLSNSCMLPHPP